jgi:hypothetical protein
MYHVAGARRDDSGTSPRSAAGLILRARPSSGDQADVLRSAPAPGQSTNPTLVGLPELGHLNHKRIAALRARSLYQQAAHHPQPHGP